MQPVKAASQSSNFTYQLITLTGHCEWYDLPLTGLKSPVHTCWQFIELAPRLLNLVGQNRPLPLKEGRNLLGLLDLGKEGICGVLGSACDAVLLDETHSVLDLLQIGLARSLVTLKILAVVVLLLLHMAGQLVACRVVVSPGDACRIVYLQKR